MEYVSGLCLHDAVDSNPRGMPVDDVLAWIHGIGAAVAYLHDHGIVHRDLKPGNVFSNEGVVKVGDYGLSKFISCSRRSGHTESIGTVHYMAPEVANGRYGKEIDVYALGVILYEMLTGRVPFEGESVGEVLMKHLTARPDVSMLPDPFRDIVAKALEKDPERRYRTVAEFLAALPQPSHALPGMGRLPSGQSYTQPRVTILPGKREEFTPENGYKKLFAETVVIAETVDDEPVLRAIKENWAKIRTVWDEANFPPVAKIALLVAGVVVFVVSFQVIVPVAICLAMVYGVYWVVRKIVLAQQGTQSARNKRTASMPQAKATSHQEQQLEAAAAELRKQRLKELKKAKKSFERATPALVLGTPKERFTELLGSLLLSCLVAVAMTVVMAMVFCFFNNAEPHPQECAWLLLTTIAGAWMVLIPSKLWEGTYGDPTLRRFVMMVLGLCLGEIAYYTTELFVVYLSSSPQFHGHSSHLRNFYGTDGRPMLMAFLAAFGALFFVMRWWSQADPLRGRRLRIWTLLVTVIVATMISAILDFPMPWLPMVAAAISVTVQLSSPWAYPRKRNKKVSNSE